MSAENSIQILRKCIDPDELAIIYPALRHDRMTWDHVQNPRFLDQVERSYQGQRKYWKPCNLALLEIEASDANQVTDPNPHYGNVDFTTLDRAEDLKMQIGTVVSLQYAGAIAYKIFNGHSRLEDLTSMLSQLVLGFDSGNQQERQAIKTLFCCFFGLQKQPVDLFIPLRNSAKSGSVDQIFIHALLANPLNLDEQFQIVRQYCQNVPFKEKVSIVSLLKAQNREGLSQKISRAFIQDGLDVDPDQKNGEQIASALQVASLYEMAGEAKKAYEILAEVSEKVSKLSTTVAIKKENLDIGQKSKSRQGANKKVVVDSHSENLEFSEQEQIKTSLDGFEESKLINSAAEIQLHYAANVEKDHQKAKKQGMAAAEKMIKEGTNDYDRAAREDACFFSPLTIVNNLEKLGLQGELLQMETKLLEKHPTNAELLQEIRDRRVNRKDWPGAYQCAQTLAALNPQDQENFKVLALILENQGKYGEAYDELGQVVNTNDIGRVDDLIALASLAKKAGKQEEAMQICEMILNEEPENIKGRLLTGSVLLNAGHYAEAESYFDGVISKEPANEEALLGKIQILKRSGETGKWFTVLKSSLASRPESARLNYEMGVALAESGSTGESKRLLKKAFLLDPENREHYAAFADALIKIDEIAEARTVVIKGLEKWSNDPELCFLAGEICFRDDDIEKAVEYLEITINSNPPMEKGIIRFGEVLTQHLDRNSSSEITVQDKERIYKSLEQLDTVNDASSNSLIKYIRAKLTFYSGEIKEALAQYRDLAQRPHTSSDDLAGKVQASIGQAALACDQIDLAIASLKEADGLDGKNILIKRWLAQAYLKANLKEDAFSQAVNALEIDSADMSNMIWYARFMSQLERNQESLAAYQKAIERSPKDLNIYLEKCMIEKELGLVDACRLTLGQLAARPDPTFDVCQVAAHQARSIGDLDLTQQFLEQGAEVCIENSAILLLQRAVILSMKNDHSRAVKLIEPIISNELHEGWEHSIAGLIYEQAGDLISAMACYKKATDGLLYTFPHDEMMDLLSDEWKNILSSQQALEYHIYLVSKSAGDLQNAYDQILKVSREAPDNIQFRFEAANLAWMLLKHDDLKELIELPVENCAVTGSVNENETGDPSRVALSQFFSLKVHWELENGNDEKAKAYWDEASELGCDSPSAVLAGIRISSRFHNSNASELHETILSEFLSDDPFTAVTYLELGDHSKALQAATSYKETHMEYPFASFNLGRVITMVRERSLFNKLFSFGHAVSEEGILNDSNLNEAFKNLSEIETFCDEQNFKKWNTRLVLTGDDAPSGLELFTGTIASSEEALAAALACWRAEEYELCTNYCILYPNFPSLSILHSLVLSRINLNESVILAGGNVQRYPEIPQAFIAQAIINERSGDLMGALRAIRSALLIQPANLDWQLKVLELAEMIGDEKEKTCALEAAYELDRSNQTLAVDLAQNRIDRGNPEKAVEILQKNSAGGNQTPRIQLLLASAFAAMKDHPQCMKCIDDVACNSLASPTDLIEAGYLAMGIDELQKGFEYARKAVMADPKNSDAIVLMSRLLNKRSGPQESVKLLEKVMEKGHADYRVRKEHTMLVSKNLNPDACIDALTRLVAENDEDPEVLELLCQTQYEKGMVTEAKENALKTLKADPERSSAHFILGKLYASEGHLDKAIHHLSECAKLNEGNPDVYIELSNVFAKRREFQQALHSLLKGIEVNPSEPGLLIAAASLYKQGKDYQQAETMLRRAAILIPGDLNVQRQLGAVVALNLVHAAQEVNITL